MDRWFIVGVFHVKWNSDSLTITPRFISLSHEPSLLSHLKMFFAFESPQLVHEHDDLVEGSTHVSRRITAQLFMRRKIKFHSRFRMQRALLSTLFEKWNFINATCDENEWTWKCKFLLGDEKPRFWIQWHALHRSVDALFMSERKAAKSNKSSCSRLINVSWHRCNTVKLFWLIFVLSWF